MLHMNLVSLGPVFRAGITEMDAVRALPARTRMSHVLFASAPL